jgi:hypothetical protein
MSRLFTTPVILPGDPAAPLQAGTKQYIDAGDAFAVTSVTAADSSIVVAGTATAPTVAVGTILFSALPTRTYAVTDVTGTGQSVQLATNSGQYQTAVWSAGTADATMLAPTDMSVGDRLVVLVRAVSAARVITPSGFIASTDFSTSARTVTSGKTAIFTLACISSGVMVAGYLVQA